MRYAHYAASHNQGQRQEEEDDNNQDLHNAILADICKNPRSSSTSSLPSSSSLPFLSPSSSSYSHGYEAGGSKPFGSIVGDWEELIIGADRELEEMSWLANEGVKCNAETLSSS
ncbi:hypothetical protein AGMMS49593_09490 [Endomicrobiia bacterium]|nr:hypothetical protein AGMMS49593_09490 [Endomicrobiia bacterium]